MAGPERNHLLNCGYGRGFSVLEVLDAVDRVTNIKIERRMEVRRAGDPDSLISDNRAILNDFPWEPPHADLEQIVTHALAWDSKQLCRVTCRDRGRRNEWISVAGGKQ